MLMLHVKAQQYLTPPLTGICNSHFTKDDFVALRLPEEERIKFLDKYKTIGEAIWHSTKRICYGARRAFEKNK